MFECSQPARRGWLLLAAGAFLLPGSAPGPAALAAQDADFLFRQPRATLTLNLGWAMPRAESDIFDWARDELTVGDRAFDAFAASGELAYRATERVDVGLEVGYSRAETLSEYREFVDLDDRPIEQTTTLSRYPLTLNVKYYFFDRGRAVSRFAWVPARWSPWVGVGGGWMWYRFSLEGDFIDFSDDAWPIYYDEAESEGSTPAFQLSGGADVSITPRFLFTGQLRYSWASAELDPIYFEGWEDIDLAGFRASAGIKVRL